MTIATLILALCVTSAADTSGGEPVLLDFHASWCGPCQTMRPEIDKLARKQYPIRSVDIDQSPEVAERYKVKAVPAFIVIDGQGRVLARVQGVRPATELASLYNDAKRKLDATPAAAKNIETQASSDRPGDDQINQEDLPAAESAETTPLVNPKPWETVVRIKMHLSSKEWGFGSGTIIHSDAEESIILTCAHIFRDSRGQQQSLKNFRTPISVDLFDGKITNPKKAQLQCVERDLPGEAIDYDFTNDVGLIRIRPGRRLMASRVVPATWQPQRGMKMYSVGCSHGNDATAWDTRILDPKVKMNGGDNKQPFFEMKCLNQPSEGRSGGGLYTTDGYVAGVCDFADPNEHVGLYAVPTAIHKLLDRNQLMALYQPRTQGPDRMLAASGRNQTKVRAQSPSPTDADLPPTEPATFTIPEPGLFKITSPETKVASNSSRAKSWQASELDLTPSPKTSRTNRRPDLNVGEAIDPGAKPGVALTTDLAMEPSAESAILDAPEPPAATPKLEPETRERRVASGKWKAVHPTRPTLSPPR